MKRLLILLFLIPNLVFATCDWSKIEQYNNGYLYPAECHLKVGQMIKTVEKQDKQIKLLEESLELKDLALTKSQQDSQRWEQLAHKFEDRIQTQHSLTKTFDAIHFGAGLLTGLAAVYLANKVNK